MIYILSWKKVSKNTFQATTFKVEENSRTFQDCANPDFSTYGVLLPYPRPSFAVTPVHSLKVQKWRAGVALTSSLFAEPNTNLD